MCEQLVGGNACRGEEGGESQKVGRASDCAGLASVKEEGKEGGLAGKTVRLQCSSKKSGRAIGKSWSPSPLLGE